MKKNLRILFGPTKSIFWIQNYLGDLAANANPVARNVGTIFHPNVNLNESVVQSS